ncbi:MAG TPA: PleD family two-component system response regulator [Gallionella sp.]|nr:PleD family two-component system response regulator [Gallionella sp.]
MSSKLPQTEILIVDDSPMNIKILGAALNDTYKVKFATSGEKALELANAESTPDLILLDIIMPGLDGYEVCKRLKENEKTKNIPVIFITAKSEVSDETKGLELGAVDYIIKPFSVPIVKARVNTHVNLKKKSDALEKLTSLDGLTNIANRRRFDEFLQQEWHSAMRTQSPISLVIMDVDFFKKYNDNYGHSAGDECLVKVARALAGALLRNTDLVARFGGEEFVAVLPGTHIEPAEAIAEKMRLNIENLNIPHAHSQAAEKVTLSLGVATTIPSSRSAFADLINAADAALYKAKELGRNRVEKIFVG